MCTNVRKSSRRLVWRSGQSGSFSKGNERKKTVPKKRLLTPNLLLPFIVCLKTTVHRFSIGYDVLCCAYSNVTRVTVDDYIRSAAKVSCLNNARARTCRNAFHIELWKRVKRDSDWFFLKCLFNEILTITLLHLDC